MRCSSVSMTGFQLGLPWHLFHHVRASPGMSEYELKDYLKCLSQILLVSKTSVRYFYRVAAGEHVKDHNTPCFRLLV